MNSRFQVSNRAILRIAVPMTLAYITTPLLGITNTFVAGQIGDDTFLGGLAVGAIVIDTVFITFGFLRTGTTALVAQAEGRRDRLACDLVFARSAFIAIAVGIVICLLSPLIAQIGAWAISLDGTAGDVLKRYVTLRLYAAPVSLLNYAILGYLLGVGRAGSALLVHVSLNGVNILLSIVLALYLDWGVDGLAIAAVVGEFVALLIGGILVPKRPKWTFAQFFNGADFGRLLLINSDIAIRTIILLLAAAVFSRQGAQLGPVILAANAILMNVFFVAVFLLEGLGAAAEQLVGRSVGAGDRKAFVRVVSLCSIWSMSISAILAVALLVSGPFLIGAISPSAEVEANANLLLPWVSLLPLSSAVAFLLDGVFIGAGWSRDMRNMMILSAVIYCLALWVLSVEFGANGLWASFHVLMLARGVSLLLVLPRRIQFEFPRQCPEAGGSSV